MSPAQKKALKFIYTQEKCIKTNLHYVLDRGDKPIPFFVKSLDRMFLAFDNYTKDNVILINDSPYKAILNNISLTFFPPSFDPFKSDKDPFPFHFLQRYLGDVLKMEKIISLPEWSVQSLRQDWSKRAN